MFKKYYKECKQELDELRKEFSEYREKQEEEFMKIRDEFDAKLFSIEHKNGIVYEKLSFIICFKIGIFYKYSRNNKIKEIKLVESEGRNFAYKIYMSNEMVYIGIKSEDIEKYFVVDLLKEVSIEIKDISQEIKDMEWHLAE